MRRGLTFSKGEANKEFTLGFLDFRLTVQRRMVRGRVGTWAQIFEREADDIRGRGVLKESLVDLANFGVITETDGEAQRPTLELEKGGEDPGGKGLKRLVSKEGEREIWGVGDLGPGWHQDKLEMAIFVCVCGRGWRLCLRGWASELGCFHKLGLCPEQCDA